MPIPSRYNSLQRQVIEVANGWLSSETLPACVFDTESTGLGDGQEIIEITIIDVNGQVLLDTLVKPSIPIPAESTAFHGITDAMVGNAPTWPEIHDQVIAAFLGRTVLAYSFGFDLQLLRAMAKMHGLAMPAETVNSEHIVMLEGGTVIQCVMRAYAVLWQESTTNERSTGGFRWKRLGDACHSQGIDASGAHRAKADCEMTLSLIKAMASSPAVFADAKARAKVLN
jgi:DNA polymerase-3 subunit epsilon